jgi:transposase-like protein
MASNEQNLKRRHQRHSWLFRRQVALEYLAGGLTLQELSAKYNVPYQTIGDWGRTYGKDLERKKVVIFKDMTAEEQKNYDELRQQNELLKMQLESIQSDQELKKENKTLKEELEFAQMKAKAMEIIMDLAKEEYGIDLRKNSGARQSVKSNKTTRRQK